MNIFKLSKKRFPDLRKKISFLLSNRKNKMIILEELALLFFYNQELSSIYDHQGDLIQSNYYSFESYNNLILLSSLCDQIKIDEKDILDIVYNNLNNGKENKF